MTQKQITLKKFSAVFEAETGFDMMDRNGLSTGNYIRENIQWFRDWAEETAQRLEHQAAKVRGA